MLNVKQYLIDRFYRCPDCDFESKVPDRLIRHFESRTDQKYDCDHCGITICTEIGLKLHIAKSHGRSKKSFPCDDCDYIGKTNFALKKHFSQKHGKSYQNNNEIIELDEEIDNDIKAEIELQEEIDNRDEFMEESDEEIVLDEHFEDSDEEIILPEESEEELDGHNFNVEFQGVKKVQLSCDYCDFVAKTSQGIKNHQRSTNRTICYCDLCNFKSCTKGLLVVHKEKVHGICVEKNIRYSCDFCDYETFDRKHFNIHEQFRESSEPEELLNCDHCYTRLCTSKAMAKHMRIKHKKPLKVNKEDNNLSELDCDICGAYLANPISLKRHKKQKHGKKSASSFSVTKIPENFECQLCHIQLEGRFQYKKHMSHEHRLGKNASNSVLHCEFCSFTSIYIGNLNRHIKQRHQDENHENNSVVREEYLPIRELESSHQNREKVYFTLPRPKKGQWIVKLEIMDLSAYE